MIEPIRGADFQTRGLLAGAQGRRALSHRPRPWPWRPGTGHGRHPAATRVAKLIAAAEEIARRLDSPYAHGMIAMARGASALMLGQWKLAQAGLDQAEQIFRNHCTGVTWERDTVHNFVLWALMQLGEMAELKRRWTVLYRESHERGDLYAATMLTDLLHDHDQAGQKRAARIRRELEAVVDRRDGRMFNLQHSSAFESLIHYHLYRGDITHAWARIVAIWPEYSQSMLLRIQMIRIHMLELRARTALAMAERVNQSAIYLRQAKNDARRLEARRAEVRCRPRPLRPRRHRRVRGRRRPRDRRAHPRRRALRRSRHAAPRPDPAVPPGRDPERRRRPRPPRRGRTMDQGPGNRLPHPLGRHVRPGLRQDLGESIETSY